MCPLLAHIHILPLPDYYLPSTIGTQPWFLLILPLCPVRSRLVAALLSLTHLEHTHRLLCGLCEIGTQVNSLTSVFPTVSFPWVLFFCYLLRFSYCLLGLSVADVCKSDDSLLFVVLSL